MARIPGDPLEHENGRPRPWRRRQRDFGYIAWSSFLMACAASAMFFAMVDPEVLSGTTTPGWEISREAGYAIGFFGFWLLTLATAVFVIWLVRIIAYGEWTGAVEAQRLEALANALLGFVGCNVVLTIGLVVRNTVRNLRGQAGLFSFEAESHGDGK
jgi:hypothetical protein